MKYNFDEIINRENTNCVKWEAIGKVASDEKAPVWVADMDFTCPLNVVKALNERCSHPIYGYTIDPESTISHITSWFKRRYNYVVADEACVLTTGVLQSLSAALRLFAKPGDEVLMAAPTYKPFKMKTELNDMVPVFTHMVWRNNRYELDFEDMEAKISDKTKVFILCNPQNPTGRMFDKEEIEQIA
ncbi:MAG: aminotransferase class I/II-fold pyridoxal phosphate-dependent enzyme, partial [Erysipelotrichaceae bacterium]|nr:aminotransferase class I/II-fold pyridoxal phosphate-dependent enzyme [Erysipelotrichaceae bacterium]